MRAVHSGTLGVLAQVAVLGALQAGVGLDAAGWCVGIAWGVGVNAAVAWAFTRNGTGRLGPADHVTLLRAVLGGGVAALVGESFVRPAPVPTLVGLASVALLLDGVDGWLARRTRTSSATGGRLDMEADALLILVLSVDAARSFGAWVLAIGLARYALAGAGWVQPWLRRAAAPRAWRKAVAAIQGVVLVVAAARVLPDRLVVVALGCALALLAESFGQQVWWLWRHRRTAAIVRYGDTPATADAQRRAGFSALAGQRPV